MSNAIAAPQNLRKADFDLDDVLDLLRKEIFMDLNCHHIATIKKVKLTSQRVDATINYSKTYYRQQADGSYTPVTKNYPILVDCPFLSLSGGNASLTFPITVGDQALILFNDRDMDNWIAGNLSGPVATNRLHSFSDGLALVGLNKITNYSSTYARFRDSGGGAEVSLKIGAGLIKLANNSTTLKTLLNELITNIKALVSATAAITVTVPPGPGTSSPPLNAATISAISSQLDTTASDIAGLLE